MTTNGKDERDRRFYQRLDEIVEADLRQTAIDEPDLAERMTEAWRAGRRRLMTEVELTADGETADLAWRLDLFVDGKWYGLSRIHWSLLADRDDAIDEVRMTMLQNGIGIPNDPSALT